MVSLQNSVAMKLKLFLVALLAFVPILLSAQTYQMVQTRNYHNQLRLNTKTGEVVQIQDDGQSWLICDAVSSSSAEGRYRLSETQNMWNFLMLDTFTGKVWQVQFSVKGVDYQFAVPINSEEFASSFWSKTPDRFQLTATQNMWNFILLDSFTGRLWQVQYSTEDLANSVCIPINERKLADASRSIFTIQPLVSMFQYYLIDNSSGAMWKFQWTTDGAEYRWIEPFR